MSCKYSRHSQSGREFVRIDTNFKSSRFCAAFLSSLQEQFTAINLLFEVELFEFI